MDVDGQEGLFNQVAEEIDVFTLELNFLDFLHPSLCTVGHVKAKAWAVGKRFM